MNARFLEKFIEYRSDEGYRLSFARLMIGRKIKYQFQVAGQKAAGRKFVADLSHASAMPQLLLIEARAAKAYWQLYRKKIGTRAAFGRRNRTSPDPVNRLLNIGYHYLFGRLKEELDKLDIPTQLGFFHKAHARMSDPFVYDCVEWLRPFAVDRILLAFLGKKKKPYHILRKEDIPIFLSKIKKSFARYYFHPKLGYCVSLAFWVRLMHQEFVGCVNDGKAYRTRFPSLRNENRCWQNKKPPVTKGGAAS